jgi:CDP-paratose 2-epimerase
MKVLITGICGFVGSCIARALQQRIEGAEIFGVDNLLRSGSEINREELRSRGIKVFHSDLRLRSDVDGLPGSDWTVDAAANPSVLAGVDGKSSARQLSEHNLAGTLNLLEYCRERRSGLALLSTNRVYSVRALASLPVKVEGNTFVLGADKFLPTGVSPLGLTEDFPTLAPVSLYGATKLASEVMAAEYGAAFGFPVWINRCGVLAGAGQFGTAEQGIFSYWLHAHAGRRKLRYIGFGGHGFQVRDAFHPDDLADLLRIQFRRDPPPDPVFHAGGGRENSMSLAQLTVWCDARFGPHRPESDDRPRPFDIPWMIMDSGRTAKGLGWRPARGLLSILDEIAEHADRNPGWLEFCGAV